MVVVKFCIFDICDYMYMSLIYVIAFIGVTVFVKRIEPSITGVSRFRRPIIIINYYYAYAENAHTVSFCPNKKRVLILTSRVFW